MKRTAKKSDTRKQRVKGSKQSENVTDLITQTEAARIRNVTRAAIGDLIKRGRLSSIEMFGKSLVYRSEVMRFEKQKPGPKAETG